MNKGVVLPIIIILAVVIGGLLYLYGGATFNPTLSDKPGDEKVSPHFTILAQGQNAESVDQRVNYRITDTEQLTALWYMIYSTSGSSIPVVDFSKHEVLAVFDGSHSSGGYGIVVTDVKGVDNKRVIVLKHVEPGDTCTPATIATSPFMLVTVDKSPLSLDHEETIETASCR